MSYEGNDRYQFQPWYVKAYRQVRYRPVGWCRGLLMLARWVGSGMPLERPYFKTRWSAAAHIWMVTASSSAMDMGHYYSTDEVIHKLRGKCHKPQN